MKITIACPMDAKELAKLHFSASNRLPNSFMIGLGTNFLIAYYKAIIFSPNSLILVARSDNGGILGFVSGTFDSGSETAFLRKRIIYLAASALPKIILKPSLICGMYRRMINSGNNGKVFIEENCSRVSFWCWTEDLSSGGKTIFLFQKWIEIAKSLGITKVFGEVDSVNKRVIALHKAMGGEFVKEYQTPDNKYRTLFVYKNS